MNFYVVQQRAAIPTAIQYPSVILRKDIWDDYGYKTSFDFEYYERKGRALFTGTVKILERNNKTTSLPAQFNVLSENYCSLGQDIAYYTALASLERNLFREVLFGLRDIALCWEYEQEFSELEGFQDSLLRKGQSLLSTAKAFVVWHDIIEPVLPRFGISSPGLTDVIEEIHSLESSRDVMTRYNYFRDPEYGEVDSLPIKVKDKIASAQEKIKTSKGILRSWGVIVADKPEDTPLVPSGVVEIITKPKQDSAADRPLRVFLCHASNDKDKVRELYITLQKEGFVPWLDEEDILAGQIWTNAVQKAVSISDVVIVCLSSSSINKEGYVQKEIVSALEIAERKPDDTIYVIPLRFEECEVPDRLQKYHYADYFDDRGVERLMRSLRTRSQDISSRQ